MKNLDLKNYGIQEMNAEEMTNTEGGFWGWLVEAIVAGIAYDLICHPGDVASSYQSGANAANKAWDKH